MDKWEYRLMVSKSGGVLYANMTPVWETVGSDGLTDLQRIQKWGDEGWEMVNAVPIASGHGNTAQLTWAFKRKAAETAGAQAGD